MSDVLKLTYKLGDTERPKCKTHRGALQVDCAECAWTAHHWQCACGFYHPYGARCPQCDETAPLAMRRRQKQEVANARERAEALAARRRLRELFGDDSGRGRAA